jgi:predicted nucleic acid-binding protein
MWPFEMGSVLSREVNKDTLSEKSAAEFLNDLRRFRISVATATRYPSEVFLAARTYGLSGYDAAYVELAIALRLPLATGDEKMREAALRAGVLLVI